MVFHNELENEKKNTNEARQIIEQKLCLIGKLNFELNDNKKSLNHKDNTITNLNNQIQSMYKY